MYNKKGLIVVFIISPFSWDLKESLRTQDSFRMINDRMAYETGIVP